MRFGDLVVNNFEKCLKTNVNAFSQLLHQCSLQLLPIRLPVIVPLTKTSSLCRIKKHKPTNVGRIALERQARQFNSGAVA